VTSSLDTQNNVAKLATGSLKRKLNNTLVVGKIIVLDYNKDCQIAQNKNIKTRDKTQLELEDIEIEITKSEALSTTQQNQHLKEIIKI